MVQTFNPTLDTLSCSRTTEIKAKKIFFLRVETEQRKMRPLATAVYATPGETSLLILARVKLKPRGIEPG